MLACVLLAALVVATTDGVAVQVSGHTPKFRSFVISTCPLGQEVFVAPVAERPQTTAVKLVLAESAEERQAASLADAVGLIPTGCEVITTPSTFSCTQTFSVWLACGLFAFPM
jgi:hypothetical protein